MIETISLKWGCNGGYQIDIQSMEVLHPTKEKATDTFAEGKRICGRIKKSAFKISQITYRLLC